MIPSFVYMRDWGSELEDEFEVLFPPLTLVVAVAAEEEPPMVPLPVVAGLVVVAVGLVVAVVGLLVVLPASPDETTTA